MPGEKQIYVVGAGLTSALLSYFLKDVCTVVVLEKARGVGGRTINKALDRSQGGSKARCDFGAQFWSLNNNTHSETRRLHQECLSKGIVTEFTGRIEGPNPYEGEKFVFPDGFHALAKYIFNIAGVEPKVGVHVASVNSTNGSVSLLDPDGASLVPDSSAAPYYVALTIPTNPALGESRFPLKIEIPDDKKEIFHHTFTRSFVVRGRLSLSLSVNVPKKS